MSIIFEEDLIKKLGIAPNSKDEKDAKFYFRVKGIKIHQKLVDRLEKTNSTITWAKVSSLIRYDKRLREKLYVYIATLEEYIRAFLSNKYENKPEQSFWRDGKNKKLKVKERISKGESVFRVLEETDFNTLILQLKKISKEDLNEMFKNVDKIEINLKAIKELRNAVSHHAFLLDYKFSKCFFNGVKGNSLEHNIKNLIQLLPKEYRLGKNGNGGIIKDIEKCKDDLECNLDKRDIINIDVKEWAK